MSKKIRVAIVGLGFGSEFISIYQNHPHAEMYGICRRDRAGLDACGDKFGIAKRFTTFEEVLKDPNVDAVHINSPIAEHAAQSLALGAILGGLRWHGRLSHKCRKRKTEDLPQRRRVRRGKRGDSKIFL